MDANFFPKPAFLEGYEVRHTEVIADNGCSYTVVFYITDVHTCLRRFGTVEFRTKSDGTPETVLTHSGSRPVAPFTVLPQRFAA